MDTEKFQNIMLEQVARITQEITEIKGRITGIEDRVTGIEDRVTGIEDRVTGIEDRISSVEGTVTRIEQEHGKKLSALFDGYQLHTEQLNRIEEKVSSHEEFILKRIK